MTPAELKAELAVARIDALLQRVRLMLKLFPADRLTVRVDRDGKNPPVIEVRL